MRPATTRQAETLSPSPESRGLTPDERRRLSFVRWRHRKNQEEGQVMIRYRTGEDGLTRIAGAEISPPEREEWPILVVRHLIESA